MESYLKSLAETKYCPLWHDQNSKPDPLPSLKGDSKCQLLIIGGGFTGLWAALQAKERLPDLDIILIESTFIADGASGRTGGILEADLAHGDANSDYHFPNEAETIDELGNVNFDEFIASLEKYNIDARFEGVGHMQVATREHHLNPLRKRYEVNVKAGANVTWYDQDDVRKKINSSTYLAGVHYKDRCGIIDPARLCWGLKKTILSLGVRIFEKTALLKITPQGIGMNAICPDGTINCEKILMATNAFHNPLSQIRKSIIPVWDYQIATAPLNKSQMSSVGWKDRHSIADRDNMFHYYRLTHDNRITWGGGGSVCYYYCGRTDQGVADPKIRFEPGTSFPMICICL